MGEKVTVKEVDRKRETVKVENKEMDREITGKRESRRLG